MSPNDFLTGKLQGVRRGLRVHCVREITASSEGHDEILRIKSPDLSATGMFISAARSFPEGTVLNLQFRLAVTGAEVCTRCEVRYSLPGVGMGVEFVGLSPQARKDIEREIALSGENRQRKKKPSRRLRASRRRVPQT